MISYWRHAMLLAGKTCPVLLIPCSRMESDIGSGPGSRTREARGGSSTRAAGARGSDRRARGSRIAPRASRAAPACCHTGRGHSACRGGTRGNPSAACMDPWSVDPSACYCCRTAGDRYARGACWSARMTRLSSSSRRVAAEVWRNGTDAGSLTGDSRASGSRRSLRDTWPADPDPDFRCYSDSCPRWRIVCWETGGVPSGYGWTWTSDPCRPCWCGISCGLSCPARFSHDRWARVAFHCRIWRELPSSWTWVFYYIPLRPCPARETRVRSSDSPFRSSRSRPAPTWSIESRHSGSSLRNTANVDNRERTMII